METPQYISHLKNADDGSGKWIFQSNEEHSEGVATLAASFAKKIGFEEWGYVLGMLHDKGKEQDGFQRYIKKESGYMPNIRNAERTPHAYIGAILAESKYPKSSSLLSMPIMAHHAGLYDFGDFKEKLKSNIPNNKIWSINTSDELKFPSISNLKPQDAHHLIRVLFSCLVDADFLDTEKFMNNQRSELREHQLSLKDLLPKLEQFLHQLSLSSEKTDLNKLRSDIQLKCKQCSNDAPGFYSLTVPTGGGKTLSSLVWAINHAIKHQKDRIIIAIPYTSIIVQTASILRNIFGVENVLEHHSAFDYEETYSYNECDGDYNIEKIKQRLASENWDYPIIVTTNVQLFQSMLANKPSACRKLHNICNSVLILDEVQMLPTEHLQPIVDCLDAYQRIFRTSILFTTASQPVLNGDHYGCNQFVKLSGLSDIKEIIPLDMCLHDKLRRVKLHFDSTPLNYDTLANKLAKYNRVLCVVNTRRDAQEIYSRLPKEGLIIHLSRMMCSAHIQKTIKELKKALNNPNQKIIRVISTQLIEAGIDIDFPIVFRQEAGLDSILQAAGRCNREGKLNMGNAFVFSLDKPLPPGSLSKGSATIKNMIGDYDWFAPKTMNEYFRRYYKSSSSFDKAHVRELMGINEWQFKEVAKEFQLIDSNGKNVIINYENSIELATQAKTGHITYGLIKKLSKYMVNLREHDFFKLMSEGLIEEISDGIYLLSDSEQYKSDIGLVYKNHWLDEILTI